MLSAIPEEAACNFSEAATSRNECITSPVRKPNQMTVNIKRTFIELSAEPSKPQRVRSLTDSELLLAGECSPEKLSDASTDIPSDETDEAVSPPQVSAKWESPCWGPAEDAYYFTALSENLLPPLPPAHMLAGGLPMPPSAFADPLLPWNMPPDDYVYPPMYPGLGEFGNGFGFESMLHCAQLEAGLEQAARFGSVDAMLADPASAATMPLPATESGQSTKTTIMLRKLPADFTRPALVEVLEDEGFEGSYDLVYVPMDFSKHCCLGYAFVNFHTASEAARCWEAFDGFTDWGVSSEGACEVVWSDPHQGTDALIERYRNSPVMHESVPEEWKPAYYVNGSRVEFPPPTERIKAPKQKTSRAKARKGYADTSPA